MIEVSSFTPPGRLFRASLMRWIYRVPNYGSICVGAQIYHWCQADMKTRRFRNLFLHPNLDDQFSSTVIHSPISCMHRAALKLSQDLHLKSLGRAVLNQLTRRQSTSCWNIIFIGHTCRERPEDMQRSYCDNRSSCYFTIARISKIIRSERIVQVAGFDAWRSKAKW